MVRAWLIAYNCIVVPLLWVGFHVLAPFNLKIRRGLAGRKHIFDTIRGPFAARGTRQTVWIHAASLGEFEQAKPLIDSLKQRFPAVFVLVTFFSPSGLEHAQLNASVDALMYIPFDSFQAAKKFVATLQPSLAIFIRYDLWFNHLYALKKTNIPAWLVCASGKSTLHKSIINRSFERAAFRQFTHISCVEQDDAAILSSFATTEMNVSVDGDTKYDRVIQRVCETQHISLIPPDVIGRKFVVVAGSTWREDEEILIPVIEQLSRELRNSFLFVVAPHEPSQERLAELQKHLRSCLLSAIHAYSSEQVIVVDSVGKLFALYRQASLAFVGGGYRQGVHNVLEPAAHGVPVVYGPRIHNAREAQDLSAAGGGTVVTSSSELREYILRAHADPAFQRAEGTRARSFTESRTGAAQSIVSSIVASGILQ